MSSNNFIHLNVDNVNEDTRQERLGFQIDSSEAILANAADYEVYIAKCEIPIPSTLPVYKAAEPMSVVLEAMDKVKKAPIFGEDLFKAFSIGSEITELSTLANSLNAVFELLGVEYQWLRFTEAGGRLTMVVLDGAKAAATRVWLPLRLYDVFTDLPHQDNGFSYNGKAYFELFSPKPAGENAYEQQDRYLHKIANLKTFRLYSTLPTESFWLYQQKVGTMNPSSLLGEIMFDSKNMVGNSNLLYIPSVFRHNSLTSDGPLSSFRLWVHAYYFNGEEVPMLMGNSDYVSVTLTFVRKQKI